MWKKIEYPLGCADPGFFFQEGGGVQVRRPENSLDNFFFYPSTYFTVYRGGSNVFITEKTILFQESRGGPTFLIGRGSNFFFLLISKETPKTCDFQGGPDPPPPLDPHMPEDVRQEGSKIS